MKKLFFTFFLLNFSFAFADSIYVTPGLYYTNGDYTNDTRANSFSFFNTTYIGKYYLTLGFDLHKLSGTGWDYDQFNYTANLVVNEFPIFYKLGYMFIDGKSNVSDPVYNSQSSGNLGSFEYVSYGDGYYLGGAVTFFSQSGSSKEKSIQFTPRFDYFYSDDFSFSIKPNYFLSSLGSSLFSTQVGLSYILTDDIFLSGVASFGNRKYYFNNDLLTIFNQLEVQKTTYNFRVDYLLTSSIRVIGNYTRSEFDGYNINYFSLGIKTGFFAF